jgi:hypothetical protein
MLGINGGGIFNANSAHPFENPTPLTNLITAISINALGWAPSSLSAASCWPRRTPRADRGDDPAVGRRGGDLRLRDATRSRRWSPPASRRPVQHGGQGGPLRRARHGRLGAMTTGASNGSVNGMHSSLMPLGGGIAMFMMQLGEILPGGIGSGLAIMVVMALLSVFVAGLMVGRTPEYLGKKVEAREIKFAILAVLILPLAILGFSAIAAVLPEALEGADARRAARLSEILYAYTSAAANNGSAFAGLTANTPWWDTTLAIAMAARPLRRSCRPGHRRRAGGQAQAGSRPPAPCRPTAALFIGLLVGVILILGGLQFFPALALGPIVEHFQVLARSRPFTLSGDQMTSRSTPGPRKSNGRRPRPERPDPRGQGRLRQARPAQADRQSGDLRHLGRGPAVDRLGRRGGGLPAAASPIQIAAGSGPPCCSPTWPRRRRRARQGGGRQPARHPRHHQGQADHRRRPGPMVPTPAHKLVPGEIVLVEAGDVIPTDGEIIEGVASVNEAAITGESAPVIREAAATARPSPAAPRSSPTGSRCGHRRAGAAPSSIA